ncbi:MAG: hypothetical protein HQL32_13430 [Planctomycetes bacterium]|nr:hypothetical protein [Planctomycetota bacterium]
MIRERNDRTQYHREGELHVYDPVPGLNPSPYYTFQVQKVSELNSPKLEKVTNWQSPFAWFTKCADKDSQGPYKAYFRNFMGSWSQTYCNFEMGPNTPIVVKIKRLNKKGAPSGPISSAVPYPARHVKSCKIIKGDIYLTLDNPALVAIDIDGQMDSRDAPRVKDPRDWRDASPYNTEMTATHSLTIFANPFIDDKPDLNDPKVYAVEPGTLPPKGGSWKTLYFKPGVHKMSVDANGRDREWRATDIITLKSGQQFYIPGDAILYGNFSDDNHWDPTDNVRIYGHGTLCGSKIPHWKDWSDELKELKLDHKKLRVLQIYSARNCTFEGITVADPAEHGFYFFGGWESYSPNYIRWVKTITWKVNNDAGGATGNTYIEDCFLRHQDDGLYVGAMAGVKRIIFWSDCNGCPLRCSFLLHNIKHGRSIHLPQKLAIEDIDIVYSRSMWDGSIIGSPANDYKKYPDGTVNTGQYVIFRNINISDPRPQRTLIGFDTKATYRGFKFENVNFAHANTWGRKSFLNASGNASFQYWMFDNVSIEGKKVNEAYFKSDHIKVNNFSDPLFR